MGVGRNARQHHRRKIEIRMHYRLNAVELLGRYADDGKLDIVQTDSPADCVGVSGETLLPGVVGKNSYRIPAGGPVFFLREGAAQRRRYFQRAEKVPADRQG